MSRYKKKCRSLLLTTWGATVRAAGLAHTIAACSGVFPEREFVSRALASAPCRNSHSTARGPPPAAAACRGVDLAPPAAPKFTYSLISSLKLALTSAALGVCAPRRLGLVALATNSLCCALAEDYWCIKIRGQECGEVNVKRQS